LANRAKIGSFAFSTNSTNPYDYLDEALRQQGLKKVPQGGFKQTWIQDGNKFQVRAHAGNPKFTDVKQIFRVSRQSAYLGVGQGGGTSYLATSGVWYHTSDLTQVFRNGLINPSYNAWAATHGRTS
jgi:hypothetical protein